MKGVARQRSHNPFLRQIALDVVEKAGLQSNDYVGEALAVGHFVLDTVRYVRDANGIEQLYDPLLLMDQWTKGKMPQGDCDDMALLLATLLLTLGHDPYLRCVRYRERSGPYQHIYVVVYEKDPQGQVVRVPLDAILKDLPIGSELPHLNGDEFPV